MAEAQPSGLPPWWRRHWLVLLLSGLGLIGLLAYAVLAVAVLPAWIVSMSGVKADENHRLDAIVNTRGALLGVLAPLVVAIGAVAAFLNYRETAAQNRRSVDLSRDTLDVTRRGQLTERFTKAVEQLSQPVPEQLAVRLGGIYALEQIALDSEELHWPVMEVLCACLRESSRTADLQQGSSAADDVGAGKPADQGQGARPQVTTDLQAIATVLGRRPEARRRQEGARRLDLGRVRLPEANLADAKLQRANLDYAELQGADLKGAKLQQAGLIGAQLQHADFTGAQLEGAYFNGAQLRGATFYGAQLQDANLGDADLDHAELGIPVDVEFDARGLTRTQLALARNVNKAVLPDYLTKAQESVSAVSPTDCASRSPVVG